MDTCDSDRGHGVPARAVSMGRIALVLLLVPQIALAAPRTFDELAGRVVQVLNAGIGVSIILGLVVFFYGLAVSVPHKEHADFERLRNTIIWGIIALFVMVSVWGILGLVRNTLFGGGGGVNLNGGDGPFCTSLDNC
jgi:hypothetical protein